MDEPPTSTYGTQSDRCNNQMYHESDMDVTYYTADAPVTPLHLNPPASRKRRMNDKAWEPWKPLIIQWSRTCTYETIARRLHAAGIDVEPKTIGHHLRRWGHLKNNVVKLESHDTPSGHNTASRRAGKTPAKQTASYNPKSLQGMCNRFSINKTKHPVATTLTDPGPSTVQSRLPPRAAESSGLDGGEALYESDPDNDVMQLSQSLDHHNRYLLPFKSLIVDAIDDPSDTNSPASLPSDIGPMTPLDSAIRSPVGDYARTLNFLGFTELEYDSHVLPHVAQQVPRQLNTPSDELHEHEFLVGFIAWFTNFWERDPQGTTLNKFSRLELTMKNLVTCIGGAISANNIGFWLNLRDLPSRLDLDNIYPNAYTTVAVYLVHLILMTAEFTKTVDVCLTQIARCMAARLGAGHPMVNLLNIASRRQLTLQFCSRLWSITRRQRVPAAGKGQIDWRVRQGHGFGAVLYYFGRAHEGQELLRLALSDVKTGGNGVDLLSINTDLKLMTARVQALGGHDPLANFAFDNIGILNRLVGMRISVGNEM